MFECDVAQISHDAAVLAAQQTRLLARYQPEGGFRAVTPDELRSALKSALKDRGPVLIEVPGEPGADASPWPFLHPWSVGG